MLSLKRLLFFGSLLVAMSLCIMLCKPFLRTTVYISCSANRDFTMQVFYGNGAGFSGDRCINLSAASVSKVYKVSLPRDVCEIRIDPGWETNLAFELHAPIRIVKGIRQRDCTLGDASIAQGVVDGRCLRTTGEDAQIIIDCREFKSYNVEGLRLVGILLSLLFISVLMCVFLSSRIMFLGHAGKDSCFYWTLGLIVILRLIVAAAIPSYILAFAMHDDAWCVNAADSLLRGQWLGTYDQYTLIKGIAAPLLMSISRVLRIPFMLANEFLYIGASLFFIWSISFFRRHRWMSLCPLLVLFFNPLSYSLLTWQRVYRCGMPLWELLIVFGGWIALLHKFQVNPARKNMPLACFIGLGLWLFFNTREDGVWLFPTIILMTLIFLVLAIVGGNVEERRRKMGVALSPILIVVIGNVIVSALNYGYYGGFVRNDRCSGNYAKAMRDLFLIETEPEELLAHKKDTYQGQYFTIYNSTIKKACRISKTLNQINDEYEYEKWRTYVNDIGEGENLSGDHCLFALRDAAAMAGFYRTWRDADDFWRRVHEELSAGFKTGKLTKSGISISPIIMPVHQNCLNRFLEEFVHCLRIVLNYEGVAPAVLPSLGSEQDVQRMEMISLDPHINSESSVRLRKELVVPCFISRLYGRFGMPIAIISLLAFVMEVVLLVCRRLEFSEYAAGVFMAFMLFCNICCIVASVAYVAATTFPAASYMYLSSAYSLMLMFEVLTLSHVLDMGLQLLRKWCVSHHVVLKGV